MSLAWKLQRLRRMSAGEVGFRALRLARTQAEAAGLVRPRAEAPRGRGGAPWVGELPRHFDAMRYARAADRILDGRFDVFALESADLGFPPRWNRDPKTGIEAPPVFGLRLDYRDPDAVGDIKYLWEINRHQELVTLAQAWHLTGDARYADGARRLLASWFDACPHALGANWSSSLEAAMRLVNWAVAWQLLGVSRGQWSRGGDGGLRDRWLAQIRLHSQFVVAHLSRHSSANNHLLGELLGLLVASITWPHWSESRSWRRFATHAFSTEALRQTHPDGVDREQAFWYHQSVANMLLFAELVCRRNGVDLDPGCSARLESMIDFVAAVMDVGGNVPRVGDADDGWIVRFVPGERDGWRSLLATGAIMFGRADLAAKAQRVDERTRWLLGDVADERWRTLTTDPAPPACIARRAFGDGGYWVLGSDFESPREVRIVADVGRLGYLSIAAHGHADALAFTLSAGGLELLIDPGTYAYHADARWRNYFRGTAAHNTVRVDARDQSESGGNFLWSLHAAARFEKWAVVAHEDELVGSHDGYRRLADPVGHRRRWRYDRRGATLTVLDELACAATHAIEIAWHFHPDCSVAIERDAIGDASSADDRSGPSVATTRIVARRPGVTLTLIVPRALDVRLERGDETQPRGWASDALDRRVPTFTAVCAATIDASATFETQLHVRFDAAGAPFEEGICAA